MAKRHLISYYLEQEQAYIEMCNDLKELDSLYEQQKISYDRYSELRERLKPQIENAKLPYEMLAYAMFLMNIPNKARKGKKYETQNKLYFAYLNKFSKENLKEESKDTLKTIKDLIKQYKGEQ